MLIPVGAIIGVRTQGSVVIVCETVDSHGNKRLHARTVNPGTSDNTMVAASSHARTLRLVRIRNTSAADTLSVWVYSDIHGSGSGAQSMWWGTVIPGHSLYYEIGQPWAVVPSGPSAAAADPSFPPGVVCSRCGRDAYQGLFEVTHRDEVAAASCPARRK